jgi:hypothetical protein
LLHIKDDGVADCFGSPTRHFGAVHQISPGCHQSTQAANRECFLPADRSARRAAYRPIQ